MKKNLKRKLRIFSSFVLEGAIALFVFLTLNLYFMPKYIEDEKDGRITAEFYREKTNNDVLFVGSSCVYNGVNPILLWENHGIASYDRANSSQTSWISYFMIKDAMIVSDPKLVVLDLNFFRNEDDYVDEPSNRKTFDGMRISATKFEALKASMAPAEDMIDYVVPIFRFHSRWKYMKQEDLRYLYYRPDVTYNGFLPNDSVQGAAEERDPYREEARRLSPRNAACLTDIIRLCRDQRVPLLLIKVPTHQPKWGAQFTNDIHQIADRENVTYLDFDYYADEIGLDYSVDTADGGGHLNRSGADKFTVYLGNLLTKYYVLPDHRTDPVYAAVWQEKCERYYHEQ